VSVAPVEYGADVDFEEVYPGVADKLQALVPLGQGDPFGTGYDAATRAFAAGEAAMFPMGVWAIAPLMESSPDLEIGAFALPSDAADDTKLITSVDTYIGVSASLEGEQKEAAMAFVDFLFSEEAHDRYVNEQYLFPVVEGVTSDSDIINQLQTDYVDTGKVGFYPEELFQSASDVGAVVQRFLQDDDQDAFLEALNSAYQAK
jgi:raffinose/stachyose/melibiose transport system substrate-binding protein